MKELFSRVAVTIGGPLVALFTTKATRKAKDARKEMYYYFLSRSVMARDNENMGIMRFVVTDKKEQRTTLYTHRNRSGKKPTADSTLEFSCYGNAPEEQCLVVNQKAYKNYCRRSSRVIASLIVGTSATRPHATLIDLDPKKNFG